MVGADGRVRLMDFGLACILDGHPLETSGRWSLRRDPSASAGHGTPGYMAPEQALGAAQDARCDIFSFCVVLFEALHGRRPVAGERASASIDAIPRAPNGWLRGRGADREQQCGGEGEVSKAPGRGSHEGSLRGASTCINRTLHGL